VPFERDVYKKNYITNRNFRKPQYFVVKDVVITNVIYLYLYI